MGSVSIALEDSLLDPFINPAKGTYINGSQFISSPVFYGFTNGDGSARTLPFSVMVSSSQWFSGLFFAMQQLEVINPNNFRIWTVPRLSQPRRLSDNFANNIYSFGLLGKRFPHRHLSIGGSFFWAKLDALDGVDLLYANSQKIEQSGDIISYRVGLSGELTGNRLYELLLLYNRLKMTQNVTYIDRVWGGSTQTRVERNLDHTVTLGIHTRYVQPVGTEGWRVGGIFTINKKSHPKIPNYEIMNIPRDPGNTWAYNVGVGVSKSENMAVIGLDVVYEPIWSHTWANTDTVMVIDTSRIISAGEKTVENYFEFANWIMRMGVRHEGDRFGFQLGLQIYSYKYWLKQVNHVEDSRRSQKEHWVEWVPSWGITLKFPEFHIRYMGRSTFGTGRPGIDQTSWWELRGGALLGDADFIIAPSGPLNLQEDRMTTHQITVSVPLNR